MAHEVGKPLERVDGRAKVTGAAKYSAEVEAEGLTHAVLIGSPIARGKVVELDTRGAEKLPGVIAILGPQNAMKLPGGPKPAEKNDKWVQALQDDQIHYSHQPVGVVVATTLEAAKEAARWVRVVTVAEPFSVRLDDELKNAFPQDISNASGTQPADQIRGKPAEAFAAADEKIDQTWDMPSEVHNPMEPHATLAIWSGPDHLTVHDATQGITGVQKKLSTAFAIPQGNVRVLSRFVGGGFGCKGTPWSHVLIAALAAKQLQRPVKLVLERSQMFGPVGARPQLRQQVALAARRDGTLTALKHHSTGTTSRFDIFVEPAALGARHMYACENIDSSHRLVRLDIGTPTYTRAPGESSGSFALESALDELSYALKMDPLELRLRNYATVDPAEGKPFSSKSLKACYQQAAEKFGWKFRPAKPGTMVRAGKRVGLGMATASYPANYSAAKAIARLLPGGRAVVQSGAVDIGGGTYTVMAQVAADALGLPASQVKFELGDSELPEAPRSGGSQTAASVASAVEAACKALKQKLIEQAVADAASPLHGLSAAEVTIDDGKLSAQGRSDTYAELLRRAGDKPVEARGEVKPEEDRKKYSLHSFGAQFVEVEVDPLLGSTRVTRMVSAFACGRILNARLARSQFIGGMVWGISMALHENAVYDGKLGRLMTHDLADYHVPTHADVPDLDVILVEEEDTVVDPAGVKGMGEIGITGAAAAIANAVFHATGRRVRSLPITPDKLI